MAEEVKTHVVLWAKDGTKVAYALVEKPKITFTETSLVIIAKDGEVNYPLDNMSRITYESSDISAIRNIITDELLIKMDGDYLLFPSLSANSVVSIHSLKGQQILKKIIQKAGEYSFPLSNLSAGVYMVTVNGLTYKILKK